MISRPTGYDIFKRWYIDGRIYYHKAIDESKPKDGIKELRYIDPRRIRKVREVKNHDPRMMYADGRKNFIEYFLYSPLSPVEQFQQDKNVDVSNQIRISPDSITYVTSGITDSKNRYVLSHLDRAIKPFNNLTRVEDAIVIYRLVRAPERRVFNIEVGNLPSMKAEQHLASIMQRNKNKVVYDAATGEIKDDKRFQTMTEDYFFAQRDGRGTTVDTLPGGQNLGDIEDVLYFQKKLYEALNVPIGRIEQDAIFSFGRPSEVSRDEVKFSKFINRLRKRFSKLFDDLLCTQVVLKGIMSLDEWKIVEQDAYYDFVVDNYFAELKEMEILRERANMARDMGFDVASFFPKKWVYQNIFQLDDEEIEELEKDLESEAEDARENGEDDNNPFGGNSFGGGGFNNQNQPPNQNPTDNQQNPPNQQPAKQQPEQQPPEKKPDDNDPEIKQKKVKKQETLTKNS